jgi:hypothetical protein
MFSGLSDPGKYIHEKHCIIFFTAAVQDERRRLMLICAVQGEQILTKKHTAAADDAHLRGGGLTLAFMRCRIS